MTKHGEMVVSNPPIQFEDGYIFRSNRSITSTPDIAITEFVANAWDAGAYNVSIVIPEEDNDLLSVEDDGTGMSDADFTQMWMTLNYDRQKRQGKIVAFPPNVESYKRVAYGRNGVGRHGMLCFADYYSVETWQNGVCNKYDVAISSGREPFRITHKDTYSKQGNGTKVSAYVNRRLPNAADMTDIISARFLYDPKFIVKINGDHIDLLNHKGVYEQKDIVLENGIKLHLTVIDSTKTALKSQQHGIAFWISGRLVGKPSWTYGGFQFLDGRFKIAKKYTLIVQTDDLMDDVLPDWTGFIDTPKMNEVYSQLKAHTDEFVSSVMAEQVEELQRDIIRETRDDLETLTMSGQRDVSMFIETITTKTPTISQDYLKIAVEAVIKIEQAKKGEQLLIQLCQMSNDDIDKLSDLLGEWDVDDILSVINEVDKRIIVIEAIDRIFNDKKTDELHTLHPLVLSARWLFGSEFDSPMFVSNSALTTVIKTLFNEQDFDLTEIANPRKRPDIVCLMQSTLRAVCTDRPDNEAGGIMKPDQILVIELKRGGHAIKADEVSQAENYVRQLRKSKTLHKVSTITAFVVGATIGDVDCNKKTDSGDIHVVTYGQLVETANKKLFNLREQLTGHYKEIGNESIVERALKEPKQLKSSSV
ncbi:MAG: ATP-binding protein [Oscillospiraceae bacterium]|nr:ATP-binding protein [Oscillospiraceae bacterium]